MYSQVEQRRKAERIVSLAASLRNVTQAPASARRGRRRRQRTWLLVLALSLTLASLPWVRGWRPVDFLIRRWQIQTSLLSDVEAARRVRQLSALGQDGLPLLVQALTDARTIVAEAAQDTLEHDIEQWKQLPLKDASRCAATLMNRLRANASAISPAVVDRLRVTVAELLRWPVDQKAVDSIALISDCEYVLAVLYRLDGVPQSASDVAASDAEESQPATQVLSDEIVSDEHTETASEDEAVTDEPELQLPAKNPIVISDLEDEYPISAEVTDGSVASIADDEPPAEAAPSLSLTDESDESDEPTDLITLAERLLDSRAEVVVAASQALERQGFHRDHISLLERLFDSDPAERRAALDQIPLTANFDGRPWLKHLSQDRDLQVRRAAIALLATSNDPDTLRHLRLLETTEKDASILDIIRKRR